MGEQFKWMMVNVQARKKGIPGLTRPSIRRDNLLL
jgi:hypothetical protein